VDLVTKDRGPIDKESEEHHDWARAVLISCQLLNPGFERSSLNSRGHKTSGLLMALSTGVFLAVMGSYAADSPTTNNLQEPASQEAAGSTHSTTTHPAAKKAAPPTTTSHSATKRSPTHHSGSAHSAASNTTSHVHSTSATKNAPNHPTAYASSHRNSTGQNKYSRNKHSRALTSQQRLARLHLQPERVQEIQQALIREGYLQGDTNGQWDSRTHDAMLRYQTMHGFPATGLPEAKSLMKLGLGSHPLPPELDHSAAGVASPGPAGGDFTVTPPSPPVSQATPPS